MAKHSPGALARAEARFQTLVDELRQLTLLFPHLQDAVDEDDLPVSFLIARDAARSGRAGSRRKAGAAKRGAKAAGRARTASTHGRAAKATARRRTTGPGRKR